MQSQEFISFLNEKEPLNEASLPQFEALLKAYPYFQSARLLYLKNLELLEHPDYARELPKTALLCSDRKKLFYWIKSEHYASFFPKKEESETQDRTQSLLDSFLGTLKDETPIIREDFHEEIPIASADYLSYMSLVDETSKNEPLPEEQPLLKHHDIIDSFIEKSDAGDIFVPPIENDTPPSKESKLSADIEGLGSGLLTETLARIYIKQKKYEQALEIIKRLNLNFPKKSVYFADQIRFLEHLILNEKYKKQ